MACGCQRPPSIMIIFIPANGLAVLLVYHTFHQSVQVSRIYTKHARIDIYQLQPLYALSLPGAFTALGLTLFVHSLFAIAPPSAPANPLGMGLSFLFVGIAVATFALPLLGGRPRLVAGKKARLGEVSSRFRAITVALHRQLDRGSIVQMDQLNNALASFQIEQDVLHKIPTWPCEPGAVRAVVAALLLPVAVWTIELLLARVFGVWHIPARLMSGARNPMGAHSQGPIAGSLEPSAGRPPTRSEGKLPALDRRGGPRAKRDRALPGAAMISSPWQ